MLLNKGSLGPYREGAPKNGGPLTNPHGSRSPPSPAKGALSLSWLCRDPSVSASTGVCEKTLLRRRTPLGELA